jgi:hypothetical protein
VRYPMLRMSAIYVPVALLLSVASADLSATVLGPVQSASYIGQPFRATIPVSGVTRNVMIAGCFQAKIESANGTLLAKPQVEVTDFDRDSGAGLITLRSRETISEPVVRLSVALACEDAVLRVYPVMMDTPERIGPLPDTSEPVARSEPVREFSGPIEKIVPTNDMSDDSIKNSNGDADKKAAAISRPTVKEPASPVIRQEIEREATQQQLKAEEQKVAGLESELTRLKMDYQIQSTREQEKLREQRAQQEQQTPPVLLIILDLIVIMLLVAAIAVAAYFIGKRPKPSLQ